MDWVTKYHITYPPPPPLPSPSSPFVFGPVCGTGGGHFPQLQAPEWEASLEDQGYLKDYPPL